MILKPLKPRKALNKAFLKVKPTRLEIDHFKANLIRLLNRTVDTESEEFHKNLVSMFLRDTWYKPNHFINTKGRTDLVIHNGPDAKSQVGVIIEAKRPNNKFEMPSYDRINTKAFQELVLYYLRERILQNNLEIKHLIATDTYEWFIFDATLFDRLFAQNKHFVQQYIDFANGRLADSRTDFFYKQIAEPFINDITTEIEFAYFSLRDYLEPLRNKSKEDDNKLIALFKLLSPEHLLKLPFANDSNSLDKRFYIELLHIIGLTETKQGSKKLIERNKEGERNSGSILEDAIIQLDSLNKISRLKNPENYGSSTQERFFNVALELSITCINRILFLKLLEAQLINYHNGDKSYAFLNKDRIKSYDDLNTLFFQVLARKFEDRNPDVSQFFEKVPYLNSSLFEPTGLEHDTLMISNLRDNKTIPIHSHTVIKDRFGKKQSGNLSTLEYLFAFLDAYDFSSEGSEEIQEESKTLINASVLGLIFEKINGYKDGSFFTPGFITMYMCRETIRRAVVQKFNEAKAWKCKNLDELYDKIEDRNEANEIVNSLKICDPAVGSGHFLVSALNEMIAVKNDLRILQDRSGRRLKEYHVEVVNDELIVTDEEGKLFEYKPGSPESQRIQEALFHEKQTIIENCLFGVDINPNSVKICRLRLWIELLKNAYYVQTLHATPQPALETLPNIDINIKYGNSLVSRFAIDNDLKQIAKSSRWNIFSYQNAVEAYKRSPEKDVKQELEKLIQSIKSNYVETIQRRNPKLQKYYRLKQEYHYRFPENGLFAREPEGTYGENAGRLEEEKQRLIAEIEKVQAETESEKHFFQTHKAFEWRFEFPEVLNEDGDFTGFDVVMGNPPYISTKDLSPEYKSYYMNIYQVAVGQFDLYLIFPELAFRILKLDGYFSFITSNTYISNKDCSRFREFISKNTTITEIVNLDETIFTDAHLDVGILSGITKEPLSNHKILIAKNKDEFVNDVRTKYLNARVVNSESHEIKFGISERDWLLFERMNAFPKLKDFVTITRGIEFGSNSNEIHDTPLDGAHPILVGNSIGKYQIKEIRGYARHEPNNLSVYKPFEVYTQPRILIQRIRNLSLKDRIIATYVEDSLLSTNTLRVLLGKNKATNLKYLLGILNSRLINYFFRLNFNNKDIYAYQLAEIPINYDLEFEREIIGMVDQILEMKKNNPEINTTALQSQIDQLVYQLYELTEEEIGLVERG